MEVCELCGKTYQLPSDVQHTREGGICTECSPLEKSKHTCRCGTEVYCDALDWYVYESCGICFVYGYPDNRKEGDRDALVHIEAKFPGLFPLRVREAQA